MPCELDEAWIFAENTGRLDLVSVSAHLTPFKPSTEDDGGYLDEGTMIGYVAQ
jgi:hypothetical protein